MNMMDINSGEMRIKKESIMSETDVSQRKAKIVCTLGSQTFETEQIVKLIDAGMNVARFDFSGDSDIKTHADNLENLQFARQQRPDQPIAIMMDTKGPVIYTGYLRDSKPINIVAGQNLKIVNDPAIEGDNTKVSVTYKQLPTTVKIGDTIYIDDGGLICEVIETHDDHIICSVKNDYTIKDRMKMNLPGAQIELPTITE